jgi:hypothetical protein
VLLVRVREFGKGGRVAHAAERRSKPKADRVVASEGDLALEPIVLGVLGGYSSVWLYPVLAGDGKTTSPPAEVAFAFDYLMSGVAGRLRESPASIPADDPAAWLTRSCVKIEQVLRSRRATGVRGLASATSRSGSFQRARSNVGGKQLRDEAVEVRRSV